MITCSFTISDEDFQAVGTLFEEVVGRTPTKKEIKKLFKSFANVMYRDSFVTLEDFYNVICSDFKNENTPKTNESQTITCTFTISVNK